jgi:hypothetical protein
MNTREIDALMKRTSVYVGTFSCDRMPNDFTGLMIVNTDPHYSPGTHWIAIFVDCNGQRGEFFDSFGRPPNELFAEYMNKHCSSWIYNKKQLQSVVSKFCGYYCVVYCMLRSLGRNLHYIVGKFTRDTGFNDALIKNCLRLIVSKGHFANRALYRFIR